MATSKRMTPAKSAKTGTKRRPAAARTTPAKPERRTGRLFVGALLVCALVGAVAAGLALLRGGHEFKLELGVPTEASAAQLGKYASSARPVYWIGAPQSGKLEVTRTASGVFVRYLPAGVDIGDSSAGYTTVATYPVPNASSRLTGWARTATYAHAKGANGALAVWPRSRATSVYLAPGGADYLVEVYDPSPRRARSLALGGSVRQVP